MAFTPFDASDFAQIAALPEGGPIPDPLAMKIEELGHGLGTSCRGAICVSHLAHFKLGATFIGGSRCHEEATYSNH